eukprot:CAMPEP_0201494280 /NCGR_PEP_ID=MMETSP0151_2-20130828/46379_1 /ASSEMBLY_ACC=CAM_ASM_000257 /TAXON_ID=200890 /ORGANISM="Paramoeba atlantica, Strain 621/1 / CCAP 1560/9" /LENGTH=255 /DNA_ID=CAMNT_0047882415 /DNA_START=44 /DNA_END=811 /DNA_ORIENTATION=-
MKTLCEDPEQTRLVPAKVKRHILPPEVQLSRFLGTKNCKTLDISESRPLRHWKGIGCDEDGVVRTIEYQYEDLLNVEWFELPETIRDVHITDCSLSCSFDLSWFPRGTTKICVEWNHLSGSLNFDDIPPKLESLDIRSNRMNGTLDLSALPEGLVELDLGRNLFTGNIDLSSLPSTLRALVLDQNSLLGLVDVTKMREGIQTLFLYQNHFTGVLDFRHVPNTLQRFNVKGNTCEVLAPDHGWHVSPSECYRRNGT